MASSIACLFFLSSSRLLSWASCFSLSLSATFSNLLCSSFLCALSMLSFLRSRTSARVDLSPRGTCRLFHAPGAALRMCTVTEPCDTVAVDLSSSISPHRSSARRYGGAFTLRKRSDRKMSHAFLDTPRTLTSAVSVVSVCLKLHSGLRGAMLCREVLFSLGVCVVEDPSRPSPPKKDLGLGVGLLRGRKQEPR